MTRVLTVAENANLLLAFLTELSVYLAVGYWGLTRWAGLPLRLLAGLGGPLLMAAVWGAFGSPDATFALHGFARAALEVGWFGAGAAALFAARRRALSGVFVVAFLLNVALLGLWQQ